MTKVTPIEGYTSMAVTLERLIGAMRASAAVQSVPAKEAYGRVAADDTIADSDVPQAPTSHMDGYAVRADDLRGAGEGHPVELFVAGEVGPGGGPKVAIAAGQAVRVATGAPVPRGADAVVPVERTSGVGKKVRTSFSPSPGSFIYPTGSDVARGSVVLRKGQVVRAQDVGLLIALGIERIKVVRRPRVAVLATGSELTDGRPLPGQVRNSHSPVFLRLLEELGCIAVDLGTVGDEPSLVAKKVRLAARREEFVITLGGTSVGRRDVTGDAVSRLKPELEFHGVRMDRGRVTGAAMVRGTPILMMPGPLQGAMNAFLLFAVPIVLKLSGRAGGLQVVDARLGRDWAARSRFSGFTKVVYVSMREGVATPIQGETESVTVLARADGFVVVPEEVSRISEGAGVRVTLLPGFSFA